jgi:esterase/lipase superfamily enzyme
MDRDYIITARGIRNGAFTNEPDDTSIGQVRYLSIAAKADDFSPGDAIPAATWLRTVVDLAAGAISPNAATTGQPEPVGDVLVFVHGYNNSRVDALQAQRRLTANLRAEGWRGLVVGFDWPSANSTLNYIEDRADGATVADRLVSGGIRALVRVQTGGCTANVHLIGHSTGAFVIMEALHKAQNFGTLYQEPWRLGQVVFIAGDVSQSSLEENSAWIEPLTRRAMRFTNYSNGHDRVLAVSNAKRFGTAPRAGRVGLVPSETARHSKLVNVDCSDYFDTLDPATHGVHSIADGLSFSHSWYFGDRLFARDLAMTLEGAIDRNAFPTRRLDPRHGLSLTQGQRPRLQRFVAELAEG